MGFFATLWSWLNDTMASYIGENTARLAAVLEPATVTIATLYVMSWGYLHLLGKIQEPVGDGLKRIVLIALVFGVGLRLWLYNTLIVDTFYTAPAQLAAAMTGAADPIGTIDAIWSQGSAVAASLWKVNPWSAPMSCAMGVAVWILVGLLCVYTLFLLGLASVASAILLALGPLFIGLALFEATRRLFSGWLTQLTHYAMVNVLTIAVTSLLLQLVRTYAYQTAARGPDIRAMDSLDLILVVGLAFLILKQVMPLASALAGGAALQMSGGHFRGFLRQAANDKLNNVMKERREIRAEARKEAKEAAKAESQASGQGRVRLPREEGGETGSDPSG